MVMSTPSPQAILWETNSPCMHTQPASTALGVSRKHLPDALESFGLQSSQRTSTSLTVPTQTRSTWQEAEPTGWWWPQRGLTPSTEAGASHPQCKGLALLRTLWQAVYLVNSTASCSKTPIRTSFCMWCIRNINMFLTPSEQPCPVVGDSGLFPDLAVPYGSTGMSRSYCRAPRLRCCRRGCCIAQRWAVPAPGAHDLSTREESTRGNKQVPGTAATQPISPMGPDTDTCLVHRRWSQTQEVYEKGGWGEATETSSFHNQWN